MKICFSCLALIVAGSGLVARAQSITAALPHDSLELASAGAVPLQSPAGISGVLQLLNRARTNYTLRNSGRGYNLHVSFTVDSDGQTDYDGSWQMEDLFVPTVGFRWQARQITGQYTITRISANAQFYGDEVTDHVPLRVQEVRAALFDPLPSQGNIAHAALRTTNAQFRGRQLTCILIGAAGAAPSTGARRWDETEDCLDPQSGLLMLHSQVPGRYAAYDYTDALRVGNHTLPRKIMISEAGRTVTSISLDGLSDMSSADPALFVPNEAMKTRGWAAEMGASRKIFAGSGSGTVCIFGVVTPSGRLAEAHSLQPSDPNSGAAIAAAKQMNFSGIASSSGHPEQHFVFIVRSFPTAE